jgi:uncharacterized iron-regulated membrane protein
MPTPRVKVNKWSRRVHRWTAVVSLLPLGLVIGTGLLLQVKKQSDWVQPPEIRGAGSTPTLDLDAILASAMDVPEAGIAGWADVDRIDVRPGRGHAKVVTRTSWEVQVDIVTGAVLHSAYRRSDLIESLHDGSFFGEWAKLGVFLPSGVLLAAMWATGIWLWWMPHAARRHRHRRPHP